MASCLAPHAARLGVLGRVVPALSLLPVLPVHSHQCGCAVRSSSESLGWHQVCGHIPSSSLPQFPSCSVALLGVSPAASWPCWSGCCGVSLLGQAGMRRDTSCPCIVAVQCGTLGSAEWSPGFWVQWEVLASPCSTSSVLEPEPAPTASPAAVTSQQLKSPGASPGAEVALRLLPVWVHGAASSPGSWAAAAARVGTPTWFPPPGVCRSGTAGGGGAEEPELAPRKAQEDTGS